jgi:hypothetical protein
LLIFFRLLINGVLQHGHVWLFIAFHLSKHFLQNVWIQVDNFFSITGDFVSIHMEQSKKLTCWKQNCSPLRAFLLHGSPQRVKALQFILERFVKDTLCNE